MGRLVLSLCLQKISPRGRCLRHDFLFEMKGEFILQVALLGALRLKWAANLALEKCGKNESFSLYLDSNIIHKKTCHTFL